MNTIISQGNIKIFLFAILFFILPFKLSAQSETWITKSSDGFVPRVGHAACVVNGKIYVFGGFSRDQPYVGIHNNLQIYDPVTDSWSTPQTIGDFKMRLHATASYVNGKIYIIGGATNYNDGYKLPTTMDILDPSTNIWSTAVTIGNYTPRSQHTASVVDGKIYITGRSSQDIGYYDSFDTTNLEVFDPVENTWTRPKTTGKYLPREGAISAVIDGKIYIIGGDSLDFSQNGFYGSKPDIFDPSTNTWTTPEVTGFLPSCRFFVSDVFNGKIYVMGGENMHSYISETNIFDPVTNTWTSPTATGKFTERDCATANTVGGHIYVLGGGFYNENIPIPPFTGAQNTNEEFTPVFDEVKESNSFHDVQLFPNPTTGLIAIDDLPESIEHLSIVNILGQKLLDISNPRASNIQLDLSKFPSGIYYAKFEMGNSVIIKKIVRQ